MPYCNICAHPYDTEEEAIKCENQGTLPFAFSFGEVLQPVVKVEEAGSFKPPLPEEIKINGRSKAPGTHENLYDVPQPGPGTVKEQYLLENFERVR